jgi:hypothetical protein
MRLIIREYLAMLKESGEFDALLPDLLLAMNIIPLSKAQPGVRQAGVDIAAVGNDPAGIRTQWLFVLKRGDVGRRDWDSQPQSVRQSLDEIKDVYLRNHVSPEHASLPVKIVVATTGDFKQEIEQNRVGYADTNKLPDRTYDFWNGDHVAALLEQHLLNEYALPAEARSQLRRALALSGQPDYDLEHYFALLRMLLAWSSDDATSVPAKSEKECIRSLATASLALGILVRWSAEEQNLRNALLACERTLLWTWDAVRSRGLVKSKEALQGYSRLVHIYLNTSVEYFNKVQAHLHTENAIARYHRESALLTERVFEEIGMVATIGLAHVLWAAATNDEQRMKGTGAIADSLKAFLTTHPCSGSPCYDGHAIDISLALLFFCFASRPDDAKAWIRELAPRLTFGFRSEKWFPISTDSFDDLVAFEIDRKDVDLKKLRETSWMIPTVAQWAASLREDQAYGHLVGLREDICKETCFQLWYPDEKTDDFRFRGPAYFESGVAEAPIELPSGAEEMRALMKRTRSESPVKERIQSSASAAGLPWLDFVACRHFRTPLDPSFWQTWGPETPAEQSEEPTATSQP